MRPRFQPNCESRPLVASTCTLLCHPSHSTGSIFRSCCSCSRRAEAAKLSLTLHEPQADIDEAHVQSRVAGLEDVQIFRDSHHWRAILSRRGLIVVLALEGTTQDNIHAVGALRA
jgi:hypothetical protein